MKKDSEEQRTSDEDFIYDGEEDDNKSTSTEADERGDESFTRDLQDILQDLTQCRCDVNSRSNVSQVVLSSILKLSTFYHFV